MVDSELILTQLSAEGYETAKDYAGADLVIVNTCGFLQEARKESCDTIDALLSTRKEGAKVIRSERYYGAVSRSMSLPAPINSQQAQAHYEHGVLTLKLPKSSPSRTQELTIQ